MWVGEITLSTEAVLAVTGLLACLSGAIGVQYRTARARERELTADLIASKNAQIRRERELNDKLLPAVEQCNRILQRLADQIQSLQRDWSIRSGPPV